MTPKVDRATFLSLAFGMAGVACNTGPGAAVAANVVEIPPQPVQPGDAGAAAVVAKVEPPAPRAVTPAPHDGDDDDDDDVGSPVDEGGAPIAAVDATCGFVDPKKVTRPAAACKDDQGTVGACAMKTCSGFPFPKQQCEDFRKNYKPKVAQRALDCLAKLTDKQVCDACNTYRCGDLALKTACPDPSADAPCAQITTKCRSVSMADCKLYLSGMNAAGRAKMTTCLTTGPGCGFGIYSCSESI